MIDHASLVEGTRTNVVQLALFGDPVPVPVTDDDRPTTGAATATQDPNADAAAQAAALVEEWADQLDLLLDGLPEEDARHAARLLYRDADGNPATRHRLLTLA